jgi:hypothetical protein
MRSCVVLCLVAGLVPACGSGHPGPERQIAEDLGRQLGVPIERVRCRPGAYPKTCTAEVAGPDGLELTVTDDADGLAWTLDGFVISTRPLAVEIAVQLDELGVEAEVDCGPTLRVTHVGDRVPCTLHGDLEGAAWARIVDDEARFELELALGAEAVAARTTASDDAELERRSRALDVGDDDELDEDDDDAPGGNDAAPDALSSVRCDASCPPSSSSP